MSKLEYLIKDKASSLGYEKCGIVPIQELEEYGHQLNERIQKVPSSEKFYQSQKRFTNLQQKFPWAKSAVIVADNYGKYRIPEQVKGHIGKTYLFDVRTDTESDGFKRSIAMENYLKELGFQIASERKFGVIPLRLAAMKAGLGIVRKNNFFYTESGSWVFLEALLIDQELELKETCKLQECPKTCTCCIKACPSGSLSSPYTMNPITCVSFLTSFGDHSLHNNSIYQTFGDWIYGCDACQDACPMNKGKWHETYDFPNVDELSKYLTPEKIMEMDEGYYQEQIQPKFFYLGLNDLWKWKINALSFMRNNYQSSYKPYILTACENENEKIRNMAQLIHRELFD